MLWWPGAPDKADAIVNTKLSANERAALEALMAAGGCFLETAIPDRTGRSFFGNPVPGMAVYRKLDKLGFLYFTEEEPFDMPGDPLDGFQFTPMVYITDEGRRALAPCDTAGHQGHQVA
jgi:hypothetical protein